MVKQLDWGVKQDQFNRAIPVTVYKTGTDMVTNCDINWAILTW